MGKVEIFPGMDNPQEIELQKSLFQDDEEMNFLISSGLEIANILRAIAMQATRICIHYCGGQRSVVTSAIGLDEHGMWLDSSWFPQEDTPLLLDGGITFVSMYQHIKIQFDLPGLAYSQLRSRRAFYLRWPAQLLRIQRREFFRSALTPASNASCLIPIRSTSQGNNPVTHHAPLLDISGGGIRLLCDPTDTSLLPDKTFSGCQLALPDTEPLTVTIEVRNNSYFTAADQSTYKGVGCRFISLARHTDILLQRHITLLQGESMNRRRPGG